MQMIYICECGVGGVAKQIAPVIQKANAPFPLTEKKKERRDLSPDFPWLGKQVMVVESRMNRLLYYTQFGVSH